MRGENLNLREAFGAVGIEQLNDIIGRVGCILDDRLIDCQNLIADRERPAPIGNTRRDDARDENTRSLNSIDAIKVCRKRHEVAQHQTHLLIHRSFDFDQERAERKFHRLHHRHLVLNGQIAERRVVSALQNLLGFR